MDDLGKKKQENGTTADVQLGYHLPPGTIRGFILELVGII